MRHARILRHFDPKRGVSVATLAYEYPAGCLVPDHAHGSDQLIYATSGMMEVHSGQSLWLVPPQFALWIPARTFHKIRMRSAVSMRTLYFRPGLVTRSDTACSVLHVTPLLRELIVEIVRIGRLRARLGEDGALRDLTVLQLMRATAAPTQVTLPRDARALAVAQRILDEPARSCPLRALCADAGVSVRTIQRIFRNHVGVDFDSWRRQVRLTRAVELLVAGLSVKQVALGVGYAQPSAFVEAFRRTFGVTPKVWTNTVCNPQTVPSTTVLGKRQMAGAFLMSGA